MARRNEEFVVDQGPSKLDLMLSLFDTDMGARTVRFRASGQLTFGWYDVQIISVRRRHPSAKIWDIEGIVKTHRGKERVSIYYFSDTRGGSMRFEGELRTEGMRRPTTWKASGLLKFFENESESAMPRTRFPHQGDR